MALDILSYLMGQKAGSGGLTIQKGNTPPDNAAGNNGDMFLQFGGVVILHQRAEAQAPVTVNDSFLGRWSGHDQYGYCVAPLVIGFAYYSSGGANPGVAFGSKSQGGYYAGYPDGYAYTHSFSNLSNYDDTTGLYYSSGTASDGPTKIPPASKIFNTEAEALAAIRHALDNDLDSGPVMNAYVKVAGVWQDLIGTDISNVELGG